MCFNSFASQASRVNRDGFVFSYLRFSASTVHAMKTEIPPFDSEIKDLTNSSL